MLTTGCAFPSGHLGEIHPVGPVREQDDVRIGTYGLGSGRGNPCLGLERKASAVSRNCGRDVRVEKPNSVRRNEEENAVAAVGEPDDVRIDMLQSGRKPLNDDLRFARPRATDIAELIRPSP